MSPSGGYEVLRLALPMIISVGSLAVMQFIDRVFLTWYNPVTVGAAFSEDLASEASVSAAAAS